MPRSNDSSPPWTEARRALADWFAREARDLPWRRERSVYRTVVSEFMLQQTRVAAVLPYFGRWMERFPGFGELAAASEAEVLALWQGLGYYSRARNLHRLARAVVSDGLPRSAAGWRRLPGIGPYTAAAVASIAQGEPVAVVDGNVVRVLARLTGDDRRWKGSAEAVDGLRPVAERFLDPGTPGRHNEAVMELGALVCLPRSPLCLLCPLSPNCDAAARGTADGLPRIEKTRKVERTVRRAWCERDGKILLRRYAPDARRLGGLLELPELDELGGSVRPAREPFARKKRGIGNESITEPIHRATIAGPLPTAPELRWVALDRLADEPLSGPHRRWIEALTTSGARSRRGR